MRNRFQKSERPPQARPRLIVYGNAQAAVVAHVLKAVPVLTDRYAIEYVDASATSLDVVPAGALLFEQSPAEGARKESAPRRSVRRIRFPELSFQLLWPFGCINPCNAPEPPDFTFGPFPHGDTFLLACLRQGVSPSDAVDLYLNAPWNAVWPDLDLLFRQESARLTALDARNDVRIGSYVLKHFRLQRLFLTPSNPADILLSELITRMLATAFPDDASIADADIPGIISSFGYRDFLGILALPIHPLVAKHFALTWFEGDALYNYFDREQLTGRDYYDRFCQHALKHDSGAEAAAERMTIAKP